MSVTCNPTASQRPHPMIPEREPQHPFTKLVRRITAGYSVRALSRATGLSTTWLQDCLWGKIPSYHALIKFCDGMGVSPVDREQLFLLAGYREEERPFVARLVRAARAAGEEVADGEYLTERLVSAIERACGRVGER